MLHLIYLLRSLFRGRCLLPPRMRKTLSAAVWISMGMGKIDVSGYGYEPIKSWSGKGVADMEVGEKYQYLKIGHVAIGVYRRSEAADGRN